jgi:cytochrome c553
MKRMAVIWVLVLALLWSLSIIPPAFAAYSAHQNDRDIQNFLAVYPFAKSTKLDDCALCHPGSPSGTSGSCDYCHNTYGTQTPHTGQVPLNPYGQAYKDAYPSGHPNYRSQQALRDIEAANSDGDCCNNIQ